MNTITQKLRKSITLKIFSILLMILLLMIPNALIKDLIRERSSRKVEIENEVGKSFGQAQNVAAPILRIPYAANQMDKEGKEVRVTGYLSIAPTNTQLDAKISTQSRKRSIYEVIVYDNQVMMDQTFDFNSVNFKDNRWLGYEFDFEKAHFILGLSDTNGLDDQSNIKVGKRLLSLIGSATGTTTHGSWIQSEDFILDLSQGLKTETELLFKGSKSVHFQPIGDKFETKVFANWTDPSFVGKSLPVHYDITDKDFTAKWSLNKFSHKYQKYWTHSGYSMKPEFGFGVKLIQPIDEYGKNQRTAKYALLIISLCFGVFFFFEILNKRNIHPIQYTLVGFALTVFYLLLLSITEHLGFNMAYVISSFATIGLIVSYMKNVLQNRRLTLLLFALISFLFIYIFVILQMQDFALLTGALALFAVLATVMYLSRNVNWYEISKSES